ncbi:LOW QUALITY PROTEIN: protein tyrosine phosphatase domain-containing protein 1 [Xyrauchen texanus]|uniref:LOW QUALITY PROTEIN: protein tyrosine phosphatase domain-containing protein 1 n=1 Tax=Xyrauchen texanus TaxID=154827 RepID=UPI0022428F26|nr:LOW QUALITY PROTEIN: protein tyrosine phosphatase domain-containing protein 1 [Xyrauchen texanus]
MTPQVPVPRPSYSQARESLVKAIPPKIICLLACGGRDCRYEGPACWSTSQQAIKGVFSSWVTDDIIAMARPSTHLIERYSIIEQFKRLNIKSIINMQLPGEHAHCGPALEPDSGFTYSPQVFMDSQIYFYNFGMTDHGVSTLEGMLDAVKVLAFSVQEGKVAVHCHAGLGRTGVLIACFLVYTSRISASEAVHYVRIKRPRSIQTQSQINLVFDFARLMGSQLAQFPCLNLRHGSTFSLGQYLQRQALLLHGEEARTLAHTPKILHVLCRMLIALTQGASCPPEVQREMEKRATILAVRKTVRDTLSKRNLPVLRERRVSCRTFSCESWDEPFGFLERKREILLNKRSYSESDLSKVIVTEDFTCTQYSPKSSGRPSSLQWTNQSRSENNRFPTEHQWQDPTDRPVNGSTEKQASIPPSAPRSSNETASKKTKCTTKKPPTVLKFSSSLELRREWEQELSSKAVAQAMAQQHPPVNTVLNRAAMLQDELNLSECGWATLVMEADPVVLSTLLWTWLDKLKDPILNKDDIERLTSTWPAQNPLNTLHKSQRHTLCCLLVCVGQVAARCPQFEHSILQRLIRALTRRPPEETERNSTLLRVLRATMRELYLHNHHLNTATQC